MKNTIWNYVYRYNHDLKLWEIGDYENPKLFRDKIGVEYIHKLLERSEEDDLSVYELELMANKKIPNTSLGYRGCNKKTTTRIKKKKLSKEQLKLAIKFNQQYGKYGNHHPFTTHLKKIDKDHEEWLTDYFGTQGMSIATKIRGMGPKMDKQTRNAYEFVLQQFKGKNKTKMLEHVRKELNNAKGLNGHIHHDNPEHRKIVNRVATAIRRARDEILANSPTAEPLLKNINTGSKLSIDLEGINQRDICLYFVR